jgi:hypothetical protein
MAGHADLFSKSRITLLWLEEQPVLFTIRPDSPFDDSSYYVWLSRLSEADWLRYLGRGPAVGGIEIKMRLFEKRSACLDQGRSLSRRCPHKFEFPQILSRYCKPAREIFYTGGICKDCLTPEQPKNDFYLRRNTE